MEISAAILEVLSGLGGVLPKPFESKYSWARRLRSFNRRQFNRGVRHLSDSGLVKVISKNDQKFIQLTQKGELKILLLKSRIPVKQKWDGKWRLVIFDIPESSKEKRHLFRFLLKANGFYKLQASVYISPNPLSSEALLYLRQSGLIEYIRILRVDAIDYDTELRKHFKLKLKEH